MSTQIMPTLAIVDPALAVTMPPAVTAHSAMDALTHAIEGMVATVSTEFSIGYALRAIRLIFDNLEASYRHASRPAREAMHVAATLAGLAVNNSTAGLAHAMDQVGPLFGLPHGLVCAVLLPHTLAFNLENAVDHYAEMATAVGIEGPSQLEQARRFVCRVVSLERAVGLPVSFEETAIDRAEYFSSVDRMVTAVISSRSAQLSPRPPIAQEARELFDKAYFGDMPHWVLQ